MYYDGPAPPRSDRPTMRPARPSAPDGRGSGETGTVPVFTHNSLDDAGAQLYPCGIATTTPQHFTVASRDDIHKPAPEFPVPPRSERVRTAPGPYPPDLSRFTFRGT
jgi:hypothetical protein